MAQPLEMSVAAIDAPPVEKWIPSPWRTVTRCPRKTIEWRKTPPGVKTLTMSSTRTPLGKRLPAMTTASLTARKTLAKFALRGEGSVSQYTRECPPRR